MEWETGQVAAVWNYINRHEPFAWPVKPDAREVLRAIVPPDEQGGFFAFELQTSAEANASVRRLVRPYLTGADRNLAARAAIWIVHNWGGIRRRSVSELEEWSNALGAYADEPVAEFIAKRIEADGVIGGVSSWSKLLSFARNDYAVYDSRTATALNCALAANGYGERFPVPNGRNDEIARAARQAAAGLRVLTYNDYRSFLQAVQRDQLALTMLDAEMVLFANAPLVARHFLSNSQG